MISSYSRQIVSGYNIDIYDNLDYGRVRGFEISVDNNFSKNFLVSLKWDFSYAFGKASSAKEAQIQRITSGFVNRDECVAHFRQAGSRPPTRV